MAASASLTQVSSTVRLLVVTGGHEFDPTFWKIFKNQPGWKVERRANEPTGACTVYDHPIIAKFGLNMRRRRFRLFDGFRSYAAMPNSSAMKVACAIAS